MHSDLEICAALWAGHKITSKIEGIESQEDNRNFVTTCENLREFAEYVDECHPPVVLFRGSEHSFSEAWLALDPVSFYMACGEWLPEEEEEEEEEEEPPRRDNMPTKELIDCLREEVFDEARAWKLIVTDYDSALVGHRILRDRIESTDHILAKYGLLEVRADRFRPLLEYNQRYLDGESDW